MTYDDAEWLLGRTTTPGAHLEQAGDSQIDPFMLTERGNAFTTAVYGTYLESYESVPAVAAHDNMYHLPDTWASYDAVVPLFDGLYREWSGQ